MGNKRRVDPAKLAAFRRRRSFDQTELATRLRKRGYGATQATVSRWENGQEPRASVLPDLAAELDVSIEDLYADDDERPPLAPSLVNDLAVMFERALESMLDAKLAERERVA